MIDRLLDLLMPPRCTLCYVRLKGRGLVCPSCAQQVRDHYRVTHTRPVEGAADSAAALLYWDRVRRIIIDCKCYNRPTLCRWGGGLVTACLLRKLPDWHPDLITYAPTTFIHWWKRGFTLAHVMARAAARSTGLPCVRTLRRPWLAKSQLRMNGQSERSRNAAETYLPVPGCDLTGKRVVLVDDVLASGATAARCISILRQMGASEVFFLCLAQTPTSAKK